MPTEGWKRLSVRGRADEALIPGVPPHLVAPLVNWIVANSDNGLLEPAAIGARLQLGDPGLIGFGYESARRNALILGLNTAGSGRDEKLLDIVDALLRLISKAPASRITDPSAPYKLRDYLELGGSMWRVNQARDGLERRVEVSVTATVESAMSAASQIRPSATAHLEEAWRFAYGRSPNPSKVFSESIKAVEAAAAPIVTPNDLKATLGKIIGEMRSNQSQWEVAIANANVAGVIEMLSMLWDGQTDRHGGVGPTIAIEPMAGDAALHLGATLVHWFVAGLVKPK